MSSQDISTESLFNPSEIGKTAKDPKGTAIEYLEKHGITHLMQKLLSDIVLLRPEDPIQYMIDQVENVSNRVDY